MYAILYEWPRRPPSKWQHWLRFLSTEMGVAHQSGILLARSESVARAIMTVLDRGIETSKGNVKPSGLELCAMDPIEFSPTDQDKRHADKVLRKLTRQGRPIKARHQIVTCHDEKKDHKAYLSEALCCPGCGSMNITVKEDL